jgi:hypothetical protein
MGGLAAQTMSSRCRAPNAGRNRRDVGGQLCVCVTCWLAGNRWLEGGMGGLHPNAAQWGLPASLILTLLDLECSQCGSDL